MCSKLETSPRVSFSEEFESADKFAMTQDDPRRDMTLLDHCNSEFEFNTSSSYDFESSSSADELFFNGVIIPIQFQHRFSVSKCSPPPTISLPPPPLLPNHVNPKISEEKDQQMEIGDSNNDVNEDEKVITTEEKPQSNIGKSFWGFKRSSSLNCDGKRSLICSLSLLSRSKSTGSSVSGKKTGSFREMNRDKTSGSHKQPQSKSPFSNYQSQQKPPLKKGFGGGGLNYHGNGIKISPVLNVPPPYISTVTANFFGLGSFLCNGSKDKNNNKK